MYYMLLWKQFYNLWINVKYVVYIDDMKETYHKKCGKQSDINRNELPNAGNGNQNAKPIRITVRLTNYYILYNIKCNASQH